MKIDQLYTAKAIREWAGNITELCGEVRKELDVMYEGDKSDDFYRGLIAGLVASEVLRSKNLGKYQTLVIAYIAERLEQKEII